MTSNVILGQWVNKSVENGLDDPYKTSYCDSKETTTVYLKLEMVDNKIALYVKGGYFCDEEIYVETAFLVDGKYEKYNFNGITINNDILVFIGNLGAETCFETFKKSTLMIVRSNDKTCGSDIYSFDMKNSSSAYNFVLNQ
jgi:hypothetical protein